MENWKQEALDLYVGSWLGDRDANVLNHGYEYANAALPWWRQQLRDNGMSFVDLGPDPTGRGAKYVARRDLFHLAEQPGLLESDDGMLQFLWHVVWWGSGKKHSHVAPKIQAFAEPTARIEFLRILRDATAAAQARQFAEAYSMLQTRGKAVIPQLGPSYFTKFLYFATAGHAALILDQRAADSLRALSCPSAPGRRPWTAGEYEAYGSTLAEWAAELSAAKTPCQPDELERALFEGKPRGSF
jgi:hypothetical protein